MLRASMSAARRPAASVVRAMAALLLVGLVARGALPRTADPSCAPQEETSYAPPGPSSAAPLGLVRREWQPPAIQRPFATVGLVRRESAAKPWPWEGKGLVRKELAVEPQPWVAQGLVR